MTLRLPAAAIDVILAGDRGQHVEQHAGMNKMIAMLVAIPSIEGGVLLVDEIEGGFYYKRLPVLWRTLFAFAKAYNVQVFASTHSAECLDAAAAVAQEHPGEFSLIRTLVEGGAAAFAI